MTKKTTHFLALCLFSLGISNVFAQLPCGPNVTMTFTQTNVSCNGGNNGAATAIVTGGTPIGYSWTPNGATTATASNLTAGVYSAGALVMAGGPPTPVYSESFDGALTWTLNTAAGANDPDANLFMISDDEGGVAPPGCGVASNGDATLYVVDANGFSTGASYNAGGLCGLGICVITNKRAESPNISTVGFTGLTLTFDFISVGQGLTDNASLVYSTNGGASWTTLAASLKSLTCAGGQGQWTAASYALPAQCENIANLRVGFVWVNDDDGVGTDPSFACNNILITGSSGGGGNCYVTGSVTITEPTALTASTMTTATSCQGQNDGSAMAMASGGTPGYTYSWSNGQTTANATNLAAGTYTAFITDAHNCTFTVTAVVQAGPALTFNTANTPTSCNGGNDGTATVTVTNGTGPFTYTWSNGQTTATASNLAAGTYVVVFMAANGCMGNTSVTITSPPALVVTPTVVQVLCAGQNTGSISLAVTGGTPAYTYSWNTGATTSNISNLASGNYSCIVTDGKGCTQTYNGTITAPAVLSVTMSSTPANPTGTATATPSGGTPPYTYSWNTTPTQTTATATGLAPGQYLCTITDANGCIKQSPVSVEAAISVEPSSIGISEMTVYPNPSDGTLSWNIALTQVQDVAISVYDINGKQLFYLTEKKTTKWNDSHFIANLSSGIYFLKIATQQGEVYQKWQVK